MEEQGLGQRQRSQLINAFMDKLFETKTDVDIVSLALIDYIDADSVNNQLIQVTVNADNLKRISNIQQRYKHGEFDSIVDSADELPLPKEPPAISTLLRIAINDQLIKL